MCSLPLSRLLTHSIRHTFAQDVFLTLTLLVQQAMRIDTPRHAQPCHAHANKAMSVQSCQQHALWEHIENVQIDMYRTARTDNH